MLQILFMILKVLGILLLAVLGIILAALLLVLFVPLRYRVDASFDEKPGGGIFVSWLLHLVTVRVNYDGSVKALIKVLWFRLLDKTVWPAEETQVSDTNEVETQIKVIVPTEGGTVTEAVEPAVPVNVAEPVEVKTIANQLAETAKPENIVESDPVKTETTENADDTGQKSKLESLIEIAVTLVQNVITKISCSYQQICGKLDLGQEKIELARSFLADQENRNTIHLLWKQVKRLLRHTLPRKISGRVRFGFEDPATTGQILTYVSPFYGLYAKTLELEPVFDEKVVEGELYVKGYIRVASLLWIVIRVFIDKNFRVLLKKVMAMGKK